MDRALNIAHCVELYHPTIGGMQEVVRQLSERMVKLGHKVTVFTSAHPDRKDGPINGVPIRSFNVKGYAGVPYEGETDAYWSALSNGGYDIITLFAAQQWTADIVLPRAAELHASKVFVPTGFSRLHDPNLAGYYEHMGHWLKEMDLNIFLSDDHQDIRFAREHGISKVAVIPNGASEEEFTGPMMADIRGTYGISPGQQVIIHVGSHTGFKGHEEAVRIFLEADTRDAVLMFVGSDIDRFEGYFKEKLRYALLRLKSRMKGKRILFLKLDRQRTVAAMRQADLFLFPSKVECSPIVLFEAMAAGIPFLASAAGNSAEIVRWTGGGWIMPGEKLKGLVHTHISKSAKMLGELLGEPHELKRAGATGHAAWKKRFTWQRITEEYLQEYHRLVK